MLPNTLLEWKFRLFCCALSYGWCQEVELSIPFRYVDTGSVKKENNILCLYLSHKVKTIIYIFKYDNVKLCFDCP